MERVGEKPRAPRRQNDAGGGAEPDAAWEQFFQADEHCDRGDPDDIHDAGDEEQAHQGPATAGAEEAVIEPHPESSAGAFAPTGHDKIERRAALSEAGMLEWGELKDAGSEEEKAAEPRAAAGHGG